MVLYKIKYNTDRKVILGEVKHLDAIAVIEDNVNPVIKKIYPDQMVDMRHLN